VPAFRYPFNRRFFMSYGDSKGEHWQNYLIPNLVRATGQQWVESTRIYRGGYGLEEMQALLADDLAAIPVGNVPEYILSNLGAMMLTRLHRSSLKSRLPGCAGCSTPNGRA
jgi:hypothetical protein